MKEYFTEEVRAPLYVLTALNQTQGLPILGLQIFYRQEEKTARVLPLSTLFELLPSFQVADQTLLNWFKFLHEQGLMQEHAGHMLYLQDELGRQILQALLLTKRCYWLSIQNPPLQEGPSRLGHFDWENAGSGLKQFRCHLAGQQSLIFRLKPFWYLDQRQWLCGPVEVDLETDIANKLLMAPPLRAPQIKALHAALGGNTFAPKRKPFIKLPDDNESLPHLHLRMLPVYLDQGLDAHTPRLAINTPIVEILFNAPETIPTLKEMGLIPIEASSFEPVGGHTTDTYFVLPESASSRWFEFNLEKLPLLRAKNWRILTSQDYPYQLVDHENVEWYTRFEEEKNHQWFDIELGIRIDGEKINLLPLLMSAIENFFTAHQGLEQLPEDGHLLAKLPDGRLLPVPMVRLKPLLSVLTEIFDRHALGMHGRIRLSRVRAAQLLALEKESELFVKMRWWGEKALLELADSLQRMGGEVVVVQPPKGLNAELRVYQREGLSWLQFLRVHQLGGILADDMGLGKTIQTLAHILLEKEEGRLVGPCLVVTPTTLVRNWESEAQKYCPQLRVLALQGSMRQEHFDALDDYDIVLTTYPLIVRDYQVLEKKKFYLIVLDEAQVVKNARSKAAILVNKLYSKYRLCLTGTPLENHLGELWSLFNFLMPGLLGERKQFGRLFKTPIEKEASGERRQILKRRIAPFVMRRTKSSVALELPTKTQIVTSIELEMHQRDLYESVRLSLHESVQQAIQRKGIANAQLIILDALLKLRQICCDPRLLKLDSFNIAEAGSAKLQYLRDTLPSLIEEGRHILLFSQFTEMLTLIEEEVKALGIPYVKLTGQTQDRVTPIEIFQAGKAPLFLISLKAGGLGLNLTAADTVIHYDPWWNPAVERQATDRAHRIGQHKPVFVYKLIMEGTIEEKIMALQQKKENLLDIFNVDDEMSVRKITAEELVSILDFL